MLAFIWRSKTEWIPPSMIESEVFMLSWSAKWSDETKIRSQVLTSAEAKAEDDGRIVEGLAKLVRKADYVVGHNVNKFDLKRLNTRVLLNGSQPLGSVQTIDTLLIARQSFDFASNRLGFIAKLLGLGEKHSTSFDLWRRCVRGEAKALKEMRAYNVTDTILVESVFRAMAPYAKKIPRLIDAAEWRQENCPYCGDPREKTASTKRHKRDGEHRTNVNTFPKYRCSNCGRNYRVGRPSAP
ncbi:hypothetical protein LCGC14_2897350 [marine sediment metagenome]|uniref:YprB ribonuclease H-like domain-containing protein n=1 Tax=marine sediment metagenome TaxID=412755 RepID=A0A0F9ALK3_9ZZZZ